MSMERLAGVWQLRTFEFSDSEGNLFYPLGQRPAGALVVTSTGHAVLSFSSSERTMFAEDDIFGGTTEERAAAAKGYVSFGGPCDVTEDTIAVRVDYSSFPNWVGGTQVRRYEIDGNTLVLRTLGPRNFGGVKRSGRAELQRA